MITDLLTFRRLVGMTLRRSLAYRLEWLFGILREIVSLVAEVAIWYALLEGVGGIVADSPVTAAEMVTYLVLALVVGTAVNAYVDEDVEQRLRSGNIVHDIVKPVGFPILLTGRSLGRTAASLISRVLPVVILAQLIWGLKPPASLAGLLAALAAVAMGALVWFSISFLAGVLGFWTWSSTQYRFLFTSLADVLSGAFVPFWFYPDWLRSIGEALPFHLMGYTPIALYLGKADPSEIATLLGSGVIWTLALSAITGLLWRRSVGRIVVQGG